MPGVSVDPQRLQHVHHGCVTLLCGVLAFLGRAREGHGWTAEGSVPIREGGDVLLGESSPQAEHGGGDRLGSGLTDTVLLHLGCVFCQGFVIAKAAILWGLGKIFLTAG